MRSQAAIGGRVRRPASVCRPRPSCPRRLARHAARLLIATMHGTWNPPPEMQVLTGSYLKGAALGLPSALFLPHFPSTAPVTLRNAANEEWGGKVTRKPLKECNSCKLPPCCPFPNWLPASRDCVAHQRCLSLASPAPACRPVALYLLLAQGLSFQQEASHVGLFVPASARNHRPCNRSTFCTPACLPAVRLELTSGWGRFAKDNRLRAGDTVQVEYLPHHTLLITVVKHAVGGAAAAAGGASRTASKARKPAAAAAAAAVDADWSDADEQHQNGWRSCSSWSRHSSSSSRAVSPRPPIWRRVSLHTSGTAGGQTSRRGTALL